jgi:D-arabinose 1-dehydrogenase-like Zn-dependent alcohol dehydrogenase
MESMVVRTPNEPLVLEEREMPQPGPGQVRVRVHACGICHSDKFVTNALWPDLELPRVPGHEVAGAVDALGDGVDGVSLGDRVGIGWHGGHDGTCDVCLTGRFIHCRNAQITGISFDGGYADYLIAPAVGLASIPEDLGFAEAAPLLCAGVTTFNALRNSGARSGDLVAIQGLGGLGHLGVQYANAMGFEVAAISRGSGKEEFAHKLGAHHYFDSNQQNFPDALTQLGGAKVILATAPHAQAISALVPGLGLEGCLLIVAAPFEPIEVGAIDLLSRDARVQGWSSGTATDSADAMAFASKHGIRPMIETFPLSDVTSALQAMSSGTVRFRAVLETSAR